MDLATVIGVGTANVFLASILNDRDHIVPVVFVQAQESLFPKVVFLIHLFFLANKLLKNFG